MKLMKVDESGRKWIKWMTVDESGLKLMKVDESGRKWMKWMKVDESL